MNEQFSIAGKVAVITGAGGVLGGSIAKCFMEQGAKVVAVDIRQEQLDKRVEELKAYGEDMVFTLPKFTLADDKQLVVELHEQQGGRHQTFTVENADLVRARVINELKVK